MIRVKFFIYGLVVGAGLTAAGFLLFGDLIRDTAADATKRVGKEVQKVGEGLEDSGDKMR